MEENRSACQASTTTTIKRAAGTRAFRRKRDSLATFERLKDEGIIRHVGVSNFTPELLEWALAAGSIFCNQVEYHVLLRRRRLHQMAVEHDLLISGLGKAAGPISPRRHDPGWTSGSPRRDQGGMT